MTQAGQAFGQSCRADRVDEDCNAKSRGSFQGRPCLWSIQETISLGAIHTNTSQAQGLYSALHLAGSGVSLEGVNGGECEQALRIRRNQCGKMVVNVFHQRYW